MNSLVLHLGIMIFFVVAWRGVFQTREEIEKILKKPMGLELRFLTNWNFGLQTGIFVGYLLYDILELCGLFNALRRRLKRILDFYFYSINLPTSFSVAIIFWVMYIYDSKLIFPRLLDQVMPLWVNHSIHSVIVINVLLQAYHNKNSPVKLGKSLQAFIVFFACYLLCLYETYFEKQVWVYPFLEKVHEPYRCISLLGLFAFCTMVSLTCHYTNSWYCSSPTKTASKQAAGHQRGKKQRS